jgi:hypothetical protein
VKARVAAMRIAATPGEKSFIISLLRKIIDLKTNIVNGNKKDGDFAPPLLT